jgi:demethylmenaquinone methyltransferase/2-methoxy-6-polyprenyl-1,4-benzoquinol methylase
MADSDRTVDFGFEKVAAADKAERVRAVFASVAGKYDIMNDLMSFGAHRLWKHFTLSLTGLRSGQRALDVAGGTGDLAAGLLRQVGKSGRVVLSDINPAMLELGRDRLLDRGFVGNVECIVADAERLPFEDNAFDCVTIGFGLRNVTDKAAALKSMHRVLKPGGQLLVLEFSTPVAPGLKPIYDAYSFTVGRLDCQRRGQLSLSGGIDPHASGSGNFARDAARGGVHPGALSQSQRRHCRRASRLQDLTCPRLLPGWHPPKPS